MSDAAIFSLAAAKQRVETLRDLNSRVVPMREEAARKEFVVRQLEAAMDGVAAQIADLGSFTLESLLQSLLMRKEKRVNEFKEEFAQLENQHEAAQNELSGVQTLLTEIEGQIAELAGADESYRSLLDQRSEEVLRGRGASADELRTLVQTLDAAKTLRSQVRGARQAAKRALERLRTMSTVQSRSRTNLGRVAARGLVVGLAVEVVKHAGAKPSTTRANEGLCELLGALEKVPSEGDGPRDQHLAELTEALRCGAVQLGHGSSGGALVETSITETIHQIIANLEERIETCEAGIEMLNSQREQLLAGA